MLKKVLAVTLLLFAGLLLYAQSDRVTLNLRNASLKEFFREIESQTDYKFSYRDSELEDKNAVTIKVENVELSSVLKSELAKAGLKYSVVGDKIVITPVPQTPSNDPFVITGKVQDSSGQPVVGATAYVKGSMRGTTTNASGVFSLEVTRGETLVVSSIGYSSEEIRVGRSSSIDVVLTDDFEMLNEAVAVGYGTTLRKNLTTSVATVKAEKVSKAANSNVSGYAFRCAGSRKRVHRNAKLHQQGGSGRTEPG